jgi:hypothetical protein
MRRRTLFCGRLSQYCFSRKYREYYASEYDRCSLHQSFDLRIATTIAKASAGDVTASRNGKYGTTL